ncbi:MAG: hypothetical protein GX673_12445 [Gammaproteobacteria bacterium]|nr:hypothetical protein [Gammaproteobacteria bacterium]
MQSKDFSNWLDNRQQFEAVIDVEHVARIAATLNEPAPQLNDELPNLWHWAFFEDRIAEAGLGRDGHPQLGEFLPPMSNKNRMWAGGRVEFVQPLLVGVLTQCTVTVKEIVEKQGSTGSLLFVTLNYEFSQDGERAVIEERNLVYREPTPPKLVQGHDAQEADWSTDVTPTPVLLFRYSAVTFNGHRIHYDYPYVTAVEGYPNLVVHGPLMATYCLQECTKANADKRVKTFIYRGLRPQILPAAFKLQGRLLDSQHAEVWVCNDSGLVQQGTVEFY